MIKKCLIILVLSLVISGCAGTWQGDVRNSMKAGAIAALAAHEVATAELFCANAMKKCTANPCPQLIKCQSVRRAVLQAVLTLTHAMKTMDEALKLVEAIE